MFLAGTQVNIMILRKPRKHEELVKTTGSWLCDTVSHGPSLEPHLRRGNPEEISPIPFPNNRENQI
jgi:hypothetical protein